MKTILETITNTSHMNVLFARCATTCFILLFGALSHFAHAANPPIFAAVDANDLPKVTAIIKADENYLNIRDENGFTPLQRASDPEKIAIAKFLIDSGADIDAESVKYGTVLQHAVSSGNVELVTILISKGVNVKAIGADKHTAMHRLAWVTDPAAAAAIFQMIYAKAPELVDDPGECGVTPLFMCVDRVNAPVAALLVSKGADPKKAPDGPDSSAVALLKDRLAKEPDLASELKAVAAAMKVQ